ncbi:TetR/AcrR family transcriptional regulator [Amycolatopsis thermoflava]|uniref:TetR/AcrR family transcriptional regulator n=1 Tax=Amycolatopsis thermoflava TaxID=84480 RepID=UPI003EBFB295
MPGTSGPRPPTRGAASRRGRGSPRRPPPRAAARQWIGGERPHLRRARDRTRSAILSAAATLLGRDYQAKLAEIANAAGVGRTTLHRYFPDRATLIKAAVEDSVADAAIDQGPALDATVDPTGVVGAGVHRAHRGRAVRRAPARHRGHRGRNVA